MTFKLVSIALLVSASSLFPQNWRLILTNGDTLSGVSLEKLAGDSILVSQDASINSIPIASLVEMRNFKKSQFLKGAGIGFLAGAAAGALIGWATYEEPQPSPESFILLDFGPGANALAGGVVGGLGGLLLGGAIGASAGKDDIYPLSTLQFPQRKEIIQLILARQN